MELFHPLDRKNREERYRCASGNSLVNYCGLCQTWSGDIQSPAADVICHYNTIHFHFQSISFDPCRSYQSIYVDHSSILRILLPGSLTEPPCSLTMLSGLLCRPVLRTDVSGCDVV